VLPTLCCIFTASPFFKRYKEGDRSFRYFFRVLWFAFLKFIDNYSITAAHVWLWNRTESDLMYRYSTFVVDLSFKDSFILIFTPIQWLLSSSFCVQELSHYTASGVWVFLYCSHDHPIVEGQLSMKSTNINNDAELAAVS